jgi:predicted N-formylglutamate amidohydrolase
MHTLSNKLLGPDEPAPVSIYNADGKSTFLLVADHAGNSIPRALGRLGLIEPDCKRHIALDIGIAGFGHLLADQLDANLIKHVNERDRAARIHEIFEPYHAQIEAELDRRQRADRPIALIALHSFTPVFKGASRPWHVGVLYNRDGRLAHQLLMLLNANNGLLVGDNAPYGVDDATDYTIPVHAERRGLHHVLVEIRQDLIEDEIGQREWALRLGDLLPSALAHSRGDG